MTIEARQAGETAKEYAYRIIKENIIYFTNTMIRQIGDKCIGIMRQVQI